MEIYYFPVILWFDVEAWIWDRLLDYVVYSFAFYVYVVMQNASNVYNWYIFYYLNICFKK